MMYYLTIFNKLSLISTTYFLMMCYLAFFTQLDLTLAPNANAS